MDWRAAVEEQRAALQRIVALLFALADLADFACARPLPIRVFVLWVLRRAEAVARDFVTGAAEPSGIGPARNTSDDAQRLAQSFRALACELERQAGFACDTETRQAGPRGALRAFALRLAQSIRHGFASCCAASATIRYDTS